MARNNPAATAHALCVRHGENARAICARNIRNAHGKADRRYWRTVLDNVRFLLDTY